MNKDLNDGHILTFEDLEAKKPKGYGIPADQYQQVIGKRLKTPKLRFEFLTFEDIG